MPLNTVSTTDNYDSTVLPKSRASRFFVQVGNQSVLVQLNVPTFGQGDSWMPPEGIELRPGYFTFDEKDFQNYGSDTAEGIRFKSRVSGKPSVISVS